VKGIVFAGENMKARRNGAGSEGVFQANILKNDTERLQM